jgi:NAD(P)-dependent dehydrogenase (short-subunit alcohol dehydrogenase family)
MNKRIIVAGSEGVIGKVVCENLKVDYDILKIDIELGHDLTDESFVKSYFSKNKAEYLVNLFALNDHIDDIRKSSNLMNISLESLRTFFEVNLVALFSVCRSFAKQKSAKGIINFSSTYGIVSPQKELYDNGEKHIGYSISKGGVTQLTRHLACHLAPRINVNCIVPGGVRYKQSKSFQARYSARTPLGRMMDAEELVGLISYLCSGKATYMTGSILTIDGGWTSI